LYAYIPHSSNGLGKVANNLMDPVTMLANFISAGSMVIGISFLFGSFLKYMQYRVNPMASPISTVILLLVMGLILICIPLLYKLTPSGIQTHV
jgi:hypothetical protein